MKPLLQETIKGTFRFLETKPNQFLKTEKKSDCTLKRSSSFEDKSYARRCTIILFLMVQGYGRAQIGDKYFWALPNFGGA